MGYAPPDFTTTATLRPEVHAKCFESFARNLIGLDVKQCILRINFDPLPIDRGAGHVAETVYHAKSVFKDVDYNCPSVPNYSMAYNWVWLRAKGTFIFNLEDDWELVEPLEIRRLYEPFENVHTLYQAIIRAYPYEYPACVTSPGLYHERFYKALAGKLRYDTNPETQVHHRADLIKCKFRKMRLEPDHYIVAVPKQPEKIIVRDIGRDWLLQQGYGMPSRKRDFTAWIRTD
jgi:hypothetical protein